MTGREMAVRSGESNPLAQRNNYWIATREAGKGARVNFTDAISAFNEYEDDEGGSQRPDLAYSNFTRSIYAPFGLNKKQVEDKQDSRDALDVILLDALRLIEGTCAEIIWEGMEKKRSRKEIKLAVKAFAAEVAQSVGRATSGGFFGGRE